MTFFEPRRISSSSFDIEIALELLAEKICETSSGWTVIVGEDAVLVAHFMTFLDKAFDYSATVMANLGRDRHPKTQRLLVEQLKAIYPDVIASTQCPLVLAGCEQDEVWILEYTEKLGFSVRQGDAHPMLCTGSELNRVFFGVNHANDLSETMRRYVEIAYKRSRSDKEQTEMEECLAQLQKHNISLDHIDPVERVS